MLHISSLNIFFTPFFRQSISIMATKSKKAHYECKQKVVCLSCGDVMLSEQEQKHTKAKPAERPWVWDSHSNTVDSEAAARAARANVSVEDQIVQIHRQKVSTID